MTECRESHEPVQSEEEERRVNLLGLDETVEEVDREGRSRVGDRKQGRGGPTSGRAAALLAKCGRGGVPPACAPCPGTPPRKEDLAGCV